MNNALAENETETLTLERMFDRILEQNSNQVNQYLEAYLKHGGSTTGGGSSTSSSDRQFLSYKSAHEANIREIGSSSDSSSSSERLRHSTKERQNYLDTVAGHARHIWTKFDFRFMFAGVVFALGALLIQVREVRRSFLESSNMEENAKKKVLLAPAATLLYCLSVLILSLSMLSNSYILSEGYVVCFLITTLLLFLAREAVVMGHQAAPVWLAGLVALNCLLCNLIPEHTGDIWNGQTQKASYQVNHVVSDSAFLFVVYLGLIQMRKRKQPIFGFNPKEALFFYNSCLAVAYSFLKRSGHGNNPDQIWHPDNLAKQVHLLTLLSLVLTVYESKVGWKTKRTQKYKSRLSFAVRSLFSLLPELYMLQIGNGGFALSLAFLQIFFSTILCAKLKFLQGRRDLELVCILVFGLYCTQIFYATGHQCQFSSLQYNAAFVGFKTFSWWRGAVLLSANTWSSHILVTFFLVVLYAKREGKAKANAFVTFGLVQSAKYLAVLVCAMLHRRHLMVWGVFAPKFVFDSVALITLDCLLLFTYTL
jgi:phosphatidylinositol glycan class O